MKIQKKIVIIGSVALLAIIIVGVLFFSNRKKIINLDNYISVELNGLDTQGKASLVVDSEQLEIDIFKALGGKVQGSEIEFNVELNVKMLTLIDSYEFTLDKNDNLSNGDVVKVSATINNDFAKQNNIVFKFAAIEKQVNGLEEATVLTSEDIFNENNLVVEFVDISPFAKVQVRNVSNDSFLSLINFTVDKSTGIKIGDKITVRAEYNAGNALYAGYIIAEDALEKTYIVDYVDQYIVTLEQIDADIMAVVEQQAEDILESWQASMCKNDASSDDGKRILKHEYTEFVKEANLFLSLKDGLELGWGNSYNRLGIVYSIHETYSEKSTYTDLSVSERDIYFCIYFDNFILRDDGNLDVVVTDGQIFNSYSSYSTYDDIKRDVLTANKQEYNTEEEILVK